MLFPNTKGPICTIIYSGILVLNNLNCLQFDDGLPQKSGDLSRMLLSNSLELVGNFPGSGKPSPLVDNFKQFGGATNRNFGYLRTMLFCSLLELICITLSFGIPSLDYWISPQVADRYCLEPYDQHRMLFRNSQKPICISRVPSKFCQYLNDQLQCQDVFLLDKLCQFLRHSGNNQGPKFFLPLNSIIRLYCLDWWLLACYFSRIFDNKSCNINRKIKLLFYNLFGILQ